MENSKDQEALKLENEIQKFIDSRDSRTLKVIKNNIK
jgi:hypothetical protein